MNKLRDKSNRMISGVPMRFSRHLGETIDWTHRLVGITGPRGVGKTTLLLQQLTMRFGNSHEALYVSLDDLYFSAHSLYQVALDFRNRGGRCIFVDEVHKYPQWSEDLLNVYQNISDLHVVFAGSSMIDLIKQGVAFCKSVKTYTLQGFSFREYLQYSDVINIPVMKLETLLENHGEISADLTVNFKPLQHFERYIRNGYYPFTVHLEHDETSWLEGLLMQTLEGDLNYMEGYDPHNIVSMKQLLYSIAQKVPFKPNVLKLSKEVGIHRNTLVVYLYHLEKAGLVQLLYPSGGMISILQKPHLLLLNNTNMLYHLAEMSPGVEVIRKTFFMNQLSYVGAVKKPRRGDFEVDSSWVFEVGEYKKSSRTLSKVPHSYFVADGIEMGSGNIIPLWMMGLLY